MGIKVKYPSNQGELGYVVNENEIIDAITADDDLVEQFIDSVINNEPLLIKLLDALIALPGPPQQG